MESSSTSGALAGTRKYREIIFSIALFLFFDLGVLVMNFYISTQIAEDALSVNLAGRQRMLSQRTVKTLLQIQLEQNSGRVATASLSELKHAFKLFDGTLSAFRDGGTAVGGNGEPVTLPAATTERGRTVLRSAYAIWNPYQKHLRPLLNVEGLVPKADLSMAISFANANNLKLLGLMNDLTSELEAVASAKATRLRIIQTTGIFFALGNFFIILFHFIRRLRRSDAEVEEARDETEEILDTVSEGLFLLDGEMVIGSQHSRSLAAILARDDVANRRLTDVLGDLVPEKTLRTSEDYIALLFKDHVNERLITELNPLDEVEVYIADGRGGFETRYLEFGFKRVLSADRQIKHLLVTVNDITQRIALARELEESQQKAQEQMDLLLKILHVEPEALREFLQRTDTALREVNEILRSRSGQRGEYHKTLNQIFPIVHTVKGDASMLGLDFFVTKAHRFEDHIAELRGRENLVGNDLLSLAVRLDQLLDEVATVRTLVNKLRNLQLAFEQSPEAQPDLLALADVERLAVKLGEEQGKQIALIHEGVERARLSDHQQRILRDILVQLARNAVAHGIEPPLEREQQGKAAIGQIELRCKPLDGHGYQFTFRDDGRGISVEKLREAATRTGKWPNNEISNWAPNRLLKLIFEPGFSTADEVTDAAGRGVGMDVIAQKVRELGGRIRLATKPGQYCEWQIILPALG